MNNKTCEQLLNMETISAAFKNKQDELSDKIVSCFFSCYKAIFLAWAKITYERHSQETILFAAENAFSDGIMRLKEDAIKGKLYKDRATVKTVLFTYCGFVLLGSLKTEQRLAEKNKKLATILDSRNEYDPFENEEETHAARVQILTKALSKMSAEERKIIRWRQIEKKSNDEIAALLAIKVPSATNRIYRCMNKLKTIVENITKSSNQP